MSSFNKIYISSFTIKEQIIDRFCSMSWFLYLKKERMKLCFCCFRFWKKDCDVCGDISSNSMKKLNQINNDRHSFWMQIISVGSRGVLFHSIRNTLAKNIEFCWNWKQKVDGCKVLLSSIKSTSAFTVAVVDSCG